MIDWPIVQTRLGVKSDGQPGPITYNALLTKVAGHTVTVGAPFAGHIPVYHVDDNPERLSAFIGQTCHESGGYRYLREIWEPTHIQSGYDARKDLGNAHPGDGFRFRGAGWIEITGRYWFDKIGHMIGIDLIGNPDLSTDPDVATLISLCWWQLNSMNAIADLGDDHTTTRKINPGLLGLDDRIRLTNIARGILNG